GRFVAFDSDATNLVAGDTNGATDVFVHDRQTGATERVSVTSGGGTQGNGNSAGFFAFPALSTDGRLAACQSDATNLVSGDTNGPTSGAALSAAGRLVAFRGAATNLVAGAANGAYDVFVHDRAVSTTTTSTTQPATTSTSSTTTTVSVTSTTSTSTTTTQPTTT